MVEIAERPPKLVGDNEPCPDALHEWLVELAEHCLLDDDNTVEHIGPHGEYILERAIGCDDRVFVLGFGGVTDDAGYDTLTLHVYERDGDGVRYDESFGGGLGIILAHGPNHPGPAVSEHAQQQLTRVQGEKLFAVLLQEKLQLQGVQIDLTDVPNPTGPVYPVRMERGLHLTRFASAQSTQSAQPN